MNETQLISWMVAKKYRLLREALQSRHLVSIAHIEIRLNNAYHWRDVLVAKISKEKSTEKVEAKFKGFFNIEIPSDVKGDCKTWIRRDEDVALAVEEAIASGYKISVKANEKNGTIIASMQCMDSSSDNAGLVMSAHAKHWYDAIAVLMWKHEKLLGKVWVTAENDFDTDIG